jgi:hypothetical protein
MPLPRRFAGFLWRFVLIYGLLIAPWPGWNAVYGRWFRAFNQLVFASNDRRILRFEPAPGERPPLDTLILLANREKEDARGQAQGKRLGLDSRGIGWVPTALFASLTLASPVGWRRRTRALVIGLLVLHCYLVFSVGCYIWNQSTDLGLVTLSPFWKAVAGGLEETLVTQLGASFVIPAILWLLVTFRMPMLDEFMGPGEPGASRPVQPGREGDLEKGTRGGV